MVSKGNFILPKHPPAHVDVITPLPNHLGIGLGRLPHLTMLKFLRKFNPVRNPFCPLPIDQLGRLVAEFFIIVGQFAQQAGQLLIQCSHVSHHFDHVFICQRFGNHLLVIGKHDQHHRQSQTTALPGGAACSPNRKVSICHQLRHVVGIDNDMTGKISLLGKPLHTFDMRCGFAHDDSHVKCLRRWLDKGIEALQNLERDIIVIDSAKIDQYIVGRLYAFTSV